MLNLGRTETSQTRIKQRSAIELVSLISKIPKQKTPIDLKIPNFLENSNSPIWRPSTETLIQKFENLQKSCIKWILSEDYVRYNLNVVYIQKCRGVNLLPLRKLFELNSLVLFHKIVYEYIPLTLPSYLTFYSGNTRLRSCHLDTLSIVCNIQSSTNRSTEIHLKKSFYFRTFSEWNALPLEIRQIANTLEFKKAVSKHFWKNILADFDDSDGEDDFT